MKKQTTRLERLGYPLYAMGQNLIYGFIGTYLSLYFSNYLFLSTTAISILFSIAKIWDAVNDPMFGAIVDKVNFKKSKFLPWLKVMGFIVPIVTILLFYINPEWNMATKLTLASVGYVVWSMCYTVCDVPAFSSLTALTSNVEERTSMLSYASIASAFAAILLVVVLAPKIETIGFRIIGTIVGLVALPLMVFYPFVAKEKNKAVSNAHDKPGLKSMFTYLKSNKYLGIFYLSYCINGMLAVSVTLVNYVMIYLIGGLKYLAIFTAIGVVPLLIIYILIPTISKKIDRMLLYKFSLISSILLSIIVYFVGYKNIYVYGALAIIKTVIATPMGLLAVTFATDCIEYGHFKSGERKEGITFSIQTFANKLNGAISSSLGMAMLTWIGFNARADIQLDTTLSGLWFCTNIIPAIGAMLSLPILFFYKLKSRDVQIMANVNDGTLMREESLKMLSREY